MRAFICSALPSIVLALVLAACGGGSGDMAATPASNASPGGIWTGTDSISGLPVEGIVEESGVFRFIRSDGVQYVGTAATSGNTVSANFDGYAEFGTEFADGSTHGAGSLSGTIVARTSISVSTQFRTDAGTNSTGTLTLTFSALYDVASSLSTVSGNYQDPDTGDIISVTSSGQVSWQDPATACVGNGMVSLINASYNAYGIQFSYSNCTGAAAVLNGVQFSGLATLNSDTNPEQATIGVTGTAGATPYAIVFGLNRD